MEELKVDPKTLKPIAYPARFTAFKRLETDQKFIAPTPDQAKAWTARNAEFERTWLTRIVEAYRGSRTRLIFISIPHQPMALPALTPIADAPDIPAMLPAQPNVIVVPEDTFAALNQPQYFVDILHLNDVGHHKLTEMLGKTLLNAVPQ